jgi:hypothetical protein
MKRNSLLQLSLQFKNCAITFRFAPPKSSQILILCNTCSAVVKSTANSLDWIIILQEYDLEFSTPKSKKALVLAELVTDLPSRHTQCTRQHRLSDEHLFYIASDDPWYGDLLVYLRTQKFGQHLSRDDRRRILHQAPRTISSLETSYTGGASTPFYVAA